MARLKTERISVNGTERSELVFKVDVSVDQEGEFTTTLPPEINKQFEDSNILLPKNRIGNRGFFSDKTYVGLIQQITNSCKEMLSRELISEEIVIRYVIKTACAYLLDEEGEVVPNGNWITGYGETKEKCWREGTVAQHATSRHPFGLEVYAKPFKKQIYRYKSGTEKTEYYELTGFGNTEDRKEKPNLAWLEGVTTVSKPQGEVQEVEYTEAIAFFFVNMYKSICKINEQIKNMIDPESIKQIVAHGGKFLG